MKRGVRKLTGLCITVISVMAMYFASAFLPTLTEIFVAGAGFIITAYGTFCTSNVIAEHKTNNNSE